MTVYRLTKDLVFPDPALADPEGLLAVGGDLSVERLLLAYSMGIFPWYSKGQPILWWSPDPRLVLKPESLHISKSLNRVLKSRKYTCRMDHRFRDVIQHCGGIDRKMQDGTWITDQMIDAYEVLHQYGFAHSVESYLDGELAGGLYGISIGKAFFGESMFSLHPDASKVALVTLTQKLESQGFHFIDCQVTTGHLLSMGAEEVSRDVFLEALHGALEHETIRGNWSDF